MKTPRLGTLFAATLLAAACGNRPSTDESGPDGVTPEAATGPAAVITEEGLRADVTRLASDEFAGRGPGTEGDRLARSYLASRLGEIGCEPAFAGGSWEQPVEIVGIRTELPPQWVFAADGGATVSFTPRRDFVADIGLQQPAARIDGAEVVFVGYGITSPEEGWDDYKGADVSGKVLLMLNDDPDWDPGLFAGERRLFYGRWVYKYESAAAQGAAAAILIHTDESAGYPWAVVQTGSAGEQFELPSTGEPRLAVRSWMTEGAARELAALGGHDLDALIAAARSRDFEPVPLGTTTSIELTAEIRSTETANVGGLLRGSDPQLAEDAVVISAHHDHFGIGEPDESGDRIYNGALDNGVAMAQALAVAEAVASLPNRPRRSFLFLFVAAEEQGLLGSLYYTRNPSFPPGRLAADINFELGNVWGRTRDVTVFGRGKSTLEDLLEEAAAAQGRVVVGESTPRAGWYYRSDQFSFARIGVPAIWFKSGTDFIGRPEGWGDARYAEWIEERYHRPSDEVEDWWNLEGLAEDARLAFAVALKVANADRMPTWYPGDEFEDERAAALQEAAATR